MEQVYLEGVGKKFTGIVDELAPLGRTLIELRRIAVLMPPKVQKLTMQTIRNLNSKLTTRRKSDKAAMRLFSLD
jgi:hypothetical protein